jgi:hypothetical protein
MIMIKIIIILRKFNLIDYDYDYLIDYVID